MFQNAKKFVDDNTKVKTAKDGSKTVTTTAEDGTKKTENEYYNSGIIKSKTVTKYNSDGSYSVTTQTTPSTTPTIVGTNINIEVDKVILTDSGRLGRLVTESELPKGYSIRNNRIFDETDSEIGVVTSKEQDIDGDGVADSIQSLYLYKEPKSHQVAKENLPENYRIRGNKILDSNGYEIGKTTTQNLNIGNGDVRTVTKYFLYDTGSEIVSIGGNRAYSVEPESFSKDYKIENNVIYNNDRKIIGIIRQISADVNGDGKADNINQYYKFVSPLDSLSELNEPDNTLKDEETKQIVRTSGGKLGQFTKSADLPEGYEIQNGRILDKEGSEIGEVISVSVDIDKDGVSDSLNSFYLYLAPKEHAIAESNLPENFRTRGDKILDEHGYEIGRTETLNLDLGNGDVRTVKKYYLYDSGNDMISVNGKTAFATSLSSFPSGYQIKNGFIYNKNNELIGVVKTTNVDSNGDGVIDSIDEYFRFID